MRPNSKGELDRLEQTFKQHRSYFRPEIASREERIGKRKKMRIRGKDGQSERESKRERERERERARKRLQTDIEKEKYESRKRIEKQTELKRQKFRETESCRKAKYVENDLVDVKMKGAEKFKKKEKSE